MSILLAFFRNSAGLRPGGAGLVALSVAATALAGQGTPVQLTTVTPLDGLSSGVITALHRDETGFLWVGTPDGLNRYDGHEARVYQFDRTVPGSLPHNQVRALLADGSGGLWVGTAGGGLARFDPTPSAFESVHSRAYLDGDTGGGWIETLARDVQGRLWIGTLGSGLSRFDPDVGTVQTFPVDPGNPAALSHPLVNVVFIDSQGAVWVGTDRGLHLWLSDEIGFRRWSHRPGDPGSLSNDRVLAIARDSAGGLWVGTEEGLNRLDEADSTFYRVPHDGRAGGQSHPHVTALAAGAGTVMWVGTYGGGLDELSTETRSVVATHRSGDLAHGLADDRVRRMITDDDGTLWVGTWGGGVTRVLPLPVRFVMESHSPEDPASLGPGEVSSIAVAADGTLWIATYFNGLHSRAPGGTAFTHHKHDPADPRSLSGDDVNRILMSGTGALWVGTWQNGLNRLDMGTGRVDRFPTDPDRPGALSAERVTALAEDRSGTLWIGTSNGLNRMEGADPPGRFSLDPGLADTYVEALLPDASGVLWVGTAGRGLVRLGAGSEGMRRFLSDPARPESLSHDHVTSLHQDPDGGIWVGTLGGGISRLMEDPGQNGPARFVHYDESTGLIDNAVAGLLSDDLGRLWVSTKGGLGVLDRGTGRFVGFDSGNGLPVQEFAVGAAARVGDHLAFGTPNGLLLVPRDARVSPGGGYPVVVTDARALEAGEALALGGGGSSRLPFGEVVVLRFALLDFDTQTAEEYAYWLEGLNTDWVSVGDTREIAFTNLAPGRYRFRVRGRARNGEWSEAGIAVGFDIVPPLWMTGWFRALALLLVVGALASALRLRVRGERRRRAAVLEREKHFAALMEYSHDIVALLDPEHRIIFHGPSTEHIIGFTAEERVGRSPLELVHPTDADAFRTWLDDLASHPNRPRRTTVRLQAKDGRWLDLEAMGTAFFTAEGERRTILNAHDISDRRQAEARSRELEQVLNQRQRLDAIGTLAGGVAHDFNNLLTVIGGHATLLESDATDPEATRESAAAILKAQQSGASLTRQLLAFARKQVVEPSVLDLNELVHDLERLLRRVLRPHATLELDQSAAWPWVEADRGQLEQVLMNLVINANDAIEAGGHIRVRTCNVEATTQDAAGVPPGQWVVVEVTDTGPGIDEGVLPHIFEPFYTTKERGQGTGLGLATVYGIVTQGGGRVTVDTTPGAGSTFRVFLPRSSSRPGTEKGRKPRANQVRDRGATILVAEDDREIRRLVARILTGAGYTVLDAEDGETASRILDRRSAPPDLLLTDLIMPRMSGGELARRARSLWPGVPVVFMSGYADAADVGGGVGLDDEVLLKPFTPGVLLARVRKELVDAGVGDAEATPGPGLGAPDGDGAEAGGTDE